MTSWGSCPAARQSAEAPTRRPSCRQDPSFHFWHNETNSSKFPNQSINKNIKNSNYLKKSLAPVSAYLYVKSI